MTTPKFTNPGMHTTHTILFTGKLGAGIVARFYAPNDDVAKIIARGIVKSMSAPRKVGVRVNYTKKGGKFTLHREEIFINPT